MITRKEKNMFPRWRRHYPARWQAMLARLDQSKGAEFLVVRIDGRLAQNAQVLALPEGM